MNKNVGGIDRYGRIVIGALVVLAGGAAVANMWEVGLGIGVVALVIGGILLVTGTTQKCPINEAAGIDTTGDNDAAGIDTATESDSAGVDTTEE